MELFVPEHGAAVRRNAARWLLLLACVGCDRGQVREASVTPEAVAAKTVEHEEPEARASERCETAACWTELAEQRRRAGAEDVAAAHLGRAHAAEPTEASLRAWLGALAATGQSRRLALALAQLEAEPRRLAAKLRATAGAPGRDRAVAPGAPSTAVRAALAAELDGRIDEAIAGFGSSAEPVDHARRGDLAWQRGDRAAARRAWAEARIEIDERGGRMRMLPMERWYTEGMFWSGERLVLVRGWRPVDPTDAVFATELQHWSIGEHARLVRSAILPGDTGAVLLSPDGERLHGTAAGSLDAVELATGRHVARWPLPGERTGALATAGAGPQALVLVGVGPGAQLVSATGEVLDRFELRGTTPTITRVYRVGKGTEHDNILEDAPTWPISGVLSQDGRWVAIGGSDSKLRLWDRQRGSALELAYAWDYEERRPMGGNPDLNLPLELRLVNGDRELLAVYRHGDVITWRTSDGKRLRTLDGTCSITEATADVNRFRTAGEPRLAPTAEQREDCGRASAAAFSADTGLVASVGSSVRVRDTATGKSVAMLADPDLPSDMLAFSSDGRLALADLYGQPRLWSREHGVTAPWGTNAPSTGPITPQLDASGRHLAFDLRGRFVVWDLEAGRDVSPQQREGERALAVAPDGAWIVAAGPAGVELRRRDGTVAWSRDVNDTTPGFIPGDKLVLAQYEGEVRVRELESGREVVLPEAGTGRRYAASASGDELVLFDHGEPLRVYDTRHGALVLALDVKARDATIAPDGSWVAWLEAPDGKETETVACWRRIEDPEDRVLRVSVPGSPWLLAAAPDGRELLVATGDAMVRWQPLEGWQRSIEQPGYIATNAIRYSADGRLLLFEGYDRIEVRENADGLPPIGSLFPLLDGGWSAMSEAGALDGSETAPEHLLTLVEGPEGDVLMHGGTLGWDRFVVEGLWMQMLAGRRAVPAIEPAPRPARE